MAIEKRADVFGRIFFVLVVNGTEVLSSYSFKEVNSAYTHLAN